MSKYLRLIEELKISGAGTMKVFGNSMQPILYSGSLLTFKVQDEYNVGDIVFCKVKKRFIDAHLITKKGPLGYMIANNKGYENGWTKSIYAKVNKGEYQNKTIYTS